MIKKKEEDLSLGDKLLSGELDAIEVDKPVSECVDSFLLPYYESVEEYSSYSAADKKLKYLLLKRFLFTAYNNLIEMDLDMSNSKVQTSKKKLNYVEKYYADLTFQLNKPIALTYESIFLSKQKNFNSVLKEQESKRKTSELFKSRAKAAEGKMAELKDQAMQYSSGSKDHEAIMSEYRKLNGSYTDYIHKMAVLRDEANALGEYIVKFRSEHKISFSQVFNALGAKLSSSILSILDGIAYEFDSILWEEARESKIIRKYFEDAHIEGSFSTKTYLKYYLKNISEDSQNEEHKELRALLEYLDNFNSKRVFILGSDSDRVSDDRFALETAEKNYSVLASIDPDKLFLEAKNKEINLIIIDFHLRSSDGLKVLKTFWDKYPDTKESVVVLMLFHSPSYEDVNRAGKEGIKYFLRYEVTERNRFVKKVKEILS